MYGQLEQQRKKIIIFKIIYYIITITPLLPWYIKMLKFQLHTVTYRNHTLEINFIEALHLHKFLSMYLHSHSSQQTHWRLPSLYPVETLLL